MGFKSIKIDRVPIDRLWRDRVPVSPLKLRVNTVKGWVHPIIKDVVNRSPDLKLPHLPKFPAESHLQGQVFLKHKGVLPTSSLF